MNASAVYMRVALCLVFAGVIGTCFADAFAADRSPVPVASADLNGDGAVDLRDFAEFQNQMGGPIPAWLRDLFDWFESGDASYAPEYVWQYRWDGEVVYYLPYYSTADGSVFVAIVLDVHGGMVCSHWPPSAGECDDFLAERTNEVLIWEE